MAQLFCFLTAEKNGLKDNIVLDWKVISTEKIMRVAKYIVSPS